MCAFFFKRNIKPTAVAIILILLCICTISPVSATINDYNSYNVLNMHMNQSAGHPTWFYDSSSSNKTVTVNGDAVTTTTTQYLGNASGYFDGSGDKLTLADSADWDYSTGNVTISAWIYPTVIINNDGNTILGQVETSADTFIFIRGDGTLAIAKATTSSLTTSVAIRTNAWSHIAVIKNQSEYTNLYLNGTLIGSSNTNFWTNSNNPLSIGYATYTTDRYFTGYMDELSIWKGVAIPIAELYPQTYEVGESLLSADPTFTYSPQAGTSPLFVQFNDTSTISPTTWNWSYQGYGINSTSGIWSTDQNASATFLTGNYTISLAVTTLTGSNTSTQNSWVNVSYLPSPVANFTYTTPSYTGTSVQFTDTSTGTPTSWNWSFGDISVTNFSNLQNPTHTYVSSGNYTVTLNSTNLNGSSIKTSSITVNNASGTNTQDIWMNGQYIITFHITDSATALPIPVVMIIDSAGSQTNTTTGTGQLTESAGTQIFYFYADGYQSKSASYIIDVDETKEIQMTKSTTDNGNQIVQYYPHQVRIRCLDYNGEPLANVQISAVGVESTISSYSWITDILGINLDTTPIHNTTMNATTGSDGAAVFLMIESFKYKLDFTSVVSSITQTSYLYPKEDNYDFVFWTETPAKASTYITITFWNKTNSTNPEYMDVGVNYTDTGATTNRLTFVIQNETSVYLTNMSSSTPNSWNISYPVLIKSGAGYVWTISGNSTRWKYPLTRSNTIQFAENVGIPFDLGAEWNNWIALVIIFTIALLFGRASLKYGVAIIPLLSLFFYYIHWLQITDLMIAAVVFFGVLFYIRFAESESDI